MPAGTPELLAVFILFCRIGACMMLMPGISSPRIPPRMRLYLAIAVTLVLTPVLLPATRPAVTDVTVATLAGLIASEVAIGASIGVLGRVFFAALQTLANAATMAIGYAPMPGAAIEGEEPMPPLVSLITLSALLLMFASGLHWEILRGLSASYAALPVSGLFDPQLALMQLARTLAEAFFLALRISSPFIVYAVIVNFAIGITNKLTPQIPVYFIALPAVLAGGLLLLYFIGPEMLLLFIDGFSGWLARG